MTHMIMSQGRLAFFSMESFEDTEELITPAPRYHVFMCVEERTELSHSPRHKTNITARALVPLTWWQPIPVVQKECQNTMRKRTGSKGAGGRRQARALTEKEGQKLTKVAHCTQAVAALASPTPQGSSGTLRGAKQLVQLTPKQARLTSLIKN